MLSFKQAVVLAGAFISTAQAAGVCYGPDGNQDAGLGVCDPSNAMSGCCQWGDSCFSNGLCQAANTTGAFTTYGVRGCTQPGGSTGECAPFARCSGKGVGITSCGSGVYCCFGLGGCDCKNSTQTFTLPAGKIIAVLPPNASAAASLAATTSTAAPTATSAAAVSASASASAAASSSSNNSAAIGAGVGVGVGVLVLLAAGAGFWVWRKKRTGGRTPLVQDDDGSDYPLDYKYGAPAVAPPGYTPSPTAQHAAEHSRYAQVSEMPHEEHQTSELEASQPVTHFSVQPHTKAVTLRDNPIEMA